MGCDILDELFGLDIGHAMYTGDTISDTEDLASLGERVGLGHAADSGFDDAGDLDSDVSTANHAAGSRPRQCTHLGRGRLFGGCVGTSLQGGERGCGISGLRRQRLAGRPPQLISTQALRQAAKLLRCLPATPNIPIELRVALLDALRLFPSDFGWD